MKFWSRLLRPPLVVRAAPATTSELKAPATSVAMPPRSRPLVLLMTVMGLPVFETGQLCAAFGLHLPRREVNV